MNKEYPSKSMTQSFLKNPTYQPNSPPTNHQSYYYSRPTTNYISYSPDRMNNSFVAPSSSFNPLPARLEHLPSKNLQVMKSCTQLQQKENARFHNKEQSGSNLLRMMQQRMFDAEKRIQKLEKQQKKQQKITKHIEEVLHLQIKDIKLNEEMEERLTILQEMMRHIKTTKMDRKELQNEQYVSTKVIQDEIKQLWKQSEFSKADLKDIKERLHRLVGKIQSSVITIGEKYEQFIESNIIKSIEHVNKLTHHYHEEIQSFKKDYMNLKDKLQTYITQEHSIKKVSPLLQLTQISIPHLKVVQSVTIINEKKGENNSYASKQTGKELRSAPGGMASYKNNLLNSLYDSIDKSIERSTSSSSAEILLEKVVYKLDKECFLLDENDHYLLDAMNNRVRLTNDHIKILEENGLIE